MSGRRIGPYHANHGPLLAKVAIRKRPAISFPAGSFSSGIPVEMQLAGAHLAEELLLRAVHAFQESSKRRLPSVRLIQRAGKPR